jgi:Zn-dependent membrane protease YugP
MAATLWLLLLAPVVLGLGAQRIVTHEFGRYRRVGNHAGVSGAEAARALLDAHGLDRVAVAAAPGTLTDAYDDAARELRLSEPVARERSVAALGVAAHEVGHAYQDAEGSRAYRLRKSVGEPLARLAPWSGLFFVGGFWFGVPILTALSLIYLGGSSSSHWSRSPWSSGRAAGRCRYCTRAASPARRRRARSGASSAPRR